MEFEIVLDVLNWLLLTNVLPQHSISMPLAIKVRSQRLYCFFCWEQEFKVTSTALLFFKVSQYFKIIFSQTSETIEEGWDNLLIFILTLVRGAQFHAQLMFGFERRTRRYRLIR